MKTYIVGLKHDAKQLANKIGLKQSQYNLVQRAEHLQGIQEGKIYICARYRLLANYREINHKLNYITLAGRATITYEPNRL